MKLLLLLVFSTAALAWNSALQGLPGQKRPQERRGLNMARQWVQRFSEGAGVAPCGS